MFSCVVLRQNTESETSRFVWWFSSRSAVYGEIRRKPSNLDLSLSEQLKRGESLMRKVNRFINYKEDWEGGGAEIARGVEQNLEN